MLAGTIQRAIAIPLSPAALRTSHILQVLDHQAMTPQPGEGNTIACCGLGQHRNVVSCVIDNDVSVEVWGQLGPHCGESWCICKHRFFDPMNVCDIRGDNPLALDERVEENGTIDYFYQSQFNDLMIGLQASCLCI